MTDKCVCVDMVAASEYLSNTAFNKQQNKMFKKFTENPCNILFGSVFCLFIAVFVLAISVVNFETIWRIICLIVLSFIWAIEWVVSIIAFPITFGFVFPLNTACIAINNDNDMSLVKKNSAEIKKGVLNNPTKPTIDDVYNFCVSVNPRTLFDNLNNDNLSRYDLESHILGNKILLSFVLIALMLTLLTLYHLIECGFCIVTMCNMCDTDKMKIGKENHFEKVILVSHKNQINDINIEIIAKLKDHIKDSSLILQLRPVIKSDDQIYNIYVVSSYVIYLLVSFVNQNIEMLNLTHRITIIIATILICKWIWCIAFMPVMLYIAKKRATLVEFKDCVLIVPSL